MNPAYRYAFDKLGYLVTEDNASRFSDEELAAWDEAVAEGERVNPPDDGPSLRAV